VESIGTVAEGAPTLPFYYYHVPVVTGIDVPSAAVVERAIRRIPNFRGVKFTDGEMSDLGRVIDICGDNLDVYYGRDDFLLPALSLGVRRAVGMSYNFTGPLARTVVDAFDQGDLPAARRAQAPIREIIGGSLPHGIVNALKAASAALGRDYGPVRAPLKSLTVAQGEALLSSAGWAGIKVK
jgi:N-acetylneuraminate lyase